MMTTCDHHMHTTFSDGTAAVDVMVQSAADKGLSAVTITDHMPLPFATRYAMDTGAVEDYRHAVIRSRDLCPERIEVFLGLEMEFIPEHREWIRTLAHMPWDRLIVSVHSIMAGETPLLVNGNEREFQALLDHFDRDIKSLCRRYYHILQEGYATGWFDIAGHLDVIKKHNQDNRFFDEKEAWYSDLIDDTLASIRAAGMTMEINTAGLGHARQETYPSDWIIRRASEKEIPLVLSSDAHRPEAVGQFFREVSRKFFPQ